MAYLKTLRGNLKYLEKLSINLLRLTVLMSLIVVCDSFSAFEVKILWSIPRTRTKITRLSIILSEKIFRRLEPFLSGQHLGLFLPLYNGLVSCDNVVKIVPSREISPSISLHIPSSCPKDLLHYL